MSGTLGRLLGKSNDPANITHCQLWQNVGPTSTKLSQPPVYAGRMSIPCTEYEGISLDSDPLNRSVVFMNHMAYFELKKSL